MQMTKKLFLTTMMDDNQPISLNSANRKDEVNLPDVVAGFKMLAVDNPEQGEKTSTSCQRRSLRKRTPRVLDVGQLNRRCSLRPKKRNFQEMESEDQIREYYLDKTVKKNTNSLETIFEEKDGASQMASCMSVKRFKRMIQFTAEPSDSKLKKRREKVKRIFGSKLCFKKKKYVTMQALVDKLNGLNNSKVVN